MRSFVATAVVIVVSVVAGLTRADTVDLITNGDFSTEPNGAGWSVVGRADLSDPGRVWLALQTAGYDSSGWASQAFGTVQAGSYVVSYDGLGGSNEGDSDTLITALYYNDAASGWQELMSQTSPVHSAQATHTFTFDALAGQPYIGRPVEIDITAGGNWVGLDNVRVTFMAAPEPGAFILLVTGVAGLLAYAWRMRR